jgi:hypothetical protein
MHCEVCGAKEVDTRPYGVNGKYICWPCGKKDLSATTLRVFKSFAEAANIRFEDMPAAIVRQYIDRLVANADKAKGW